MSATAVLVVIVALALAIVGVLVMLLRDTVSVTRIQHGDAEQKPAPAPSKPAGSPIVEMLRRERDRVRRNPLVLLLGTPGSHELRFLDDVEGLTLRDHPSPGGPMLLPRGTVLDVDPDDAAWNAIVRELMAIRPARPVDAVVVTIDCAALTDAAARAPRLRDRLGELQERIGFRLPLYVLVTGCESRFGFDDTVAALRDTFPDKLGQMLGWSSPYGAQVPYRSAWIDEAFGSLIPVLRHLQMELFRAGSQADGVLLFPRSMAQLEEPLRAVLDRLLDPGAGEAAITRGIYFCGTLPESKTPVFVTELFARKIFPEVGLAEPTPARQAALRRRVRALQLAAAVTATTAIAGLVFAAQTLDARHERLVPLLDAAKSGIGAVHDAKPADQISGAASELLARMSKADFEHYSPWWLPLSWLTGFDARLHAALGEAFRVVVMKSILDRIDDSAKARIEEAKAAVPPPVERLDAARTPSELPARTAELARLRAFVDQMREVELQGARFNRVAAGGGFADRETLSALVKYAFGADLPSALFPIELKAAALFQPSEYALDATTAATSRKEALYAKIFRDNPCAARVERAAELSDPSLLRSPGRGVVSRERLRELDGVLNDLQKDFSTDAVEWSFRRNFDLGPEFNGVLRTVGRSAMFEHDTDKRFRDDGARQLVGLQQRLSTRTPAGTPVLRMRAPDLPAMELSPDTQLMQVAVQKYLGQTRGEWAIPIPTGSIRVPMPYEHLWWDGNELDQSAAAYRAWTEFRDSGMKPYPRDLPPDLSLTIAQTAQQRASAEMTAALVRAQHFDPVPPGLLKREEDVRTQSAMFEAAAKVLRPQLAQLAEVHADERVRSGIVAANRAEAVRELRAVSELLKDAAPYEPVGGNFRWWDGPGAPSPAGWGQRDADALKEYLETTRGRVATLASYAAPPLAWLNEFGPGDALEMVKQWRTIVRDLDAFNAKKPGNQPAMLDDYIAVRAAKVSSTDCTAGELQAAELAVDGWFAARLHSIAGRLRQRCAELATAKYDDVARLFNQRLAGRYPFSSEPPRGGEAEARPEDVRFFFREYDKDKGLFGSFDGDPALKPERDFVRDVDKVRLFFAAFLDAKKPLPLPQIHVEPSFRVMPEREHGANEVILWSLELGRDVATQRKNKPLLWQPGAALTLTLKWADDAPRVPVLSAPQRNVTVNGRTVVYRYSNTWSLLAALHDLRVDDGSDPQPVTLSVNVLTKPAAGGDPDPFDRALLFVRLALSNGEGQPLELPPFPTSAPLIGGKIAEGSP
ncbi:MAG TPA: type VI secretion system protein [Thermoanaerobaculia bacterium]|nr:type VI secretion system protein [Thermoanaerobaculia bacterium]